jgi:hypothetical protein
MKPLLSFNVLLENEMWEPVFENRGTNYKFNSFFIYLSKDLSSQFSISE